jgi:ferric-dicitrate binding protein FerR (iron transport regulator)
MKMKDYKNYKCSDWLADDLFIKTMPTPKGKMRLYWQRLMDEGEIDPDEFIAAISMLEAVAKHKPKMSQESKYMLWKRIAATRRPLWRKRSTKMFLGILLAAACLAGIIFYVLPLLTENTEKGIIYADFQVINRQEIDEEITIVTKNKQLKLDGDNPNVSYDSAGKLSVNQQTMTHESEENKAAEPTINHINVPFGKRAQLKLSDGTLLWLNTGTKVVYPNVFAGNKREIFVDGEIYIDVKPDADHPFIVKTNGLEICVLGTEFNLSAYQKDELKQVVLISGSVEVNQNGVGLHMKPGQMYSVSKLSNSLKTVVDTELYTSWRKGIYIFDDEPIEGILLKLARYYNVTMILPQAPSGVTCYGKLKLKEELPSLLNSLSQIASFNFSVKDNQYWIQFN